MTKQMDNAPCIDVRSLTKEQLHVLVAVVRAAGFRVAEGAEYPWGPAEPYFSISSGGEAKYFTYYSRNKMSYTEFVEFFINGRLKPRQKYLTVQGKKFGPLFDFTVGEEYFYVHYGDVVSFWWDGDDLDAVMREHFVLFATREAATEYAEGLPIHPHVQLLRSAD